MVREAENIFLELKLTMSNSVTVSFNILCFFLFFHAVWLSKSHSARVKKKKSVKINSQRKTAAMLAFSFYLKGQLIFLRMFAIYLALGKSFADAAISGNVFLYK